MEREQKKIDKIKRKTVNELKGSKLGEQKLNEKVEETQAKQNKDGAS